MLNVICILVVLNMLSLFFRWTCQKLRRLTVRTRNAGSTPYTRLPSTRKERIAFLLRGSVVMTASSQDMVGRQSLFFTRRPRQQRRSFWSCSARAASTTLSTRSRGASTLKSVETRRARELHSSKMLILPCSPILCQELALRMFLSCLSSTSYISSCFQSGLFDT